MRKTADPSDVAGIGLSGPVRRSRKLSDEIYDRITVCVCIECIALDSRYEGERCEQSGDSGVPYNLYTRRATGIINKPGISAAFI